ncbi:hypothetical protein O1611_g8861 [Lasiodiplodia mahajangana]|uniref:Uncharacterized protein n=1 Tax=Lasiodiplodia mahajangana TaxID=1108764 RepID=A0ACC2JBP1_9PEZI|nr:hypothetical protein O1611_g8861 [Lasiodiplodia mahajangana]
MKLAIKLLCGHKTRAYSSADIATGLVSLDIRNRQSISRLELSVAGSFDSDEFQDDGFGYTQKAPYYRIFEISKVLFPTPPLCSSTRYTLTKGRHEYKFGLDFSLLARCMSARLAHLPTPKRRQAANRAYFEIEATAKGCGLLRHRVYSRIYITLVQIDPPNIPPMLYDGQRLLCQAYQAIPCTTLGLSKEAPEVYSHEYLPVYCPALVLGASVGGDAGSSSRLLHPGEPLSLNFWVTMPGDCTETVDVYLRSVCISLIDPAITTNGGRQIAHLSSFVIWNVQLETPLRMTAQIGTAQVDPALWRECIVPEIAGGSGKEKQPFLLRVLCEFSASTLSCNVFAAVLVPVTLDNALPPPEYTNTADSSGVNVEL